MVYSCNSFTVRDSMALKVCWPHPQADTAPPPAPAPPQGRRLLLELAAGYAVEALLEVS